MIDLDDSFEYSDAEFVTIPLEGTAISIFPNPFTDVLFIENKNIDTSSFVEVFDIHGKIILETTLDIETTSISLSHLERGVYFVRIKNKSGEAVFVEKILKF